MNNINLNRFLIIFSLLSIFIPKLCAMEPPSGAQDTGDIRTRLTTGQHYIRWECLDRECNNRKDEKILYLYEGKDNDGNSIVKLSPKVSPEGQFIFRINQQGVSIMNSNTGNYMYFDTEAEEGDKGNGIKFNSKKHTTSYFNFFTPDTSYNTVNQAYIIRNGGVSMYMEPSKNNKGKYKYLKPTVIESPHCFFSFEPCARQLFIKKGKIIKK